MLKVIATLFVIFALSSAQQDTPACINDVNSIVGLCQSLSNPTFQSILGFIPEIGFSLVQVSDDCGFDQNLAFIAAPEFEIDPTAFAIPECDEDIYNLIQDIINLANNPPTNFDGELSQVDSIVSLIEDLNAAFLDCNVVDAPEEIIEAIAQAVTDGELVQIGTDLGNEIVAAVPDVEQYYQDFENNVKNIAQQTGEDIENVANQAGNGIANTATQTGEDIENVANQAGNGIANTATQTGEDIENTATQTGEDIENTATQAGEDIESTANSVGEDIENFFGGWFVKAKTAVVSKFEKLREHFLRKN